MMAEDLLETYDDNDSGDDEDDDDDGIGPVGDI